METLKGKIILLSAYVITCMALGYYHAKVNASLNNSETVVVSNKN
ncbi:hypothetical protein ACLVWU_02940 [Bdellovibrio sp. HCB290]